MPNFFKFVFLIGFFFAKNLFASDFDNLTEELKIISTKSEKLNSLIAENEKLNSAAEEVLAKISKNSTQKTSLIDNYNIIADSWRGLVDKSFNFSNSRRLVKIFRPKVLDEKFDEDSKEFSLQQKLLKKFEIARDKYEFFKVDVRNSQLAILSRTGKMRAQILSEILREDENFLSKENKFYFSDLYREVRLIPYRPIILFYDKLDGYKKLLNSGAAGLVEIASQIFWLLFFLIILTFASKIFAKISESLNNFRKSLIKLSIENREKNKGLIAFLPKIIPYFSWAVLLLITDILYVFLSQMALAELAIILPFFAYYFLYRILKIFIISFLNQNITVVSFNSNFGKRVEFSAQFLSRFFLIWMWVLLLTENIVRKALFYNIVSQIFVMGVFVSLFYLASLWKDEIFISVEKNISEKLINKIKALNEKFALIYSFPLLVFVLAWRILQKILNILSKNDLIKTLSSQIYRKKLEVAAKKVEQVSQKKDLPESYVNNFMDNGKFKEDELIEVKSHPYNKIKDNINLWFDEHAKENSLVIYSKSGMGKTMILQQLQQEFSDHDLKIINYKISEKITKEEQLKQLIKQLLDLQVENSEVAKSVENFEQKTLILLDDCHNLFLSKRGCLDAFKSFASLVNSSSDNIFWVCTFDNFAWNYLYNALDISKYFRYNFKIPRWRDVDIKNLILKKHEISGFKMVYDPLIFAIQAQSSKEEFEDINQKFFQMLWGQSKGNPRLAMMLWLSSLSVINDDTLKINLPHIASSSQLFELPDEQFFIYASIAKHHNLTLEDIVESLNISYALALNVVRIGIEKGYLVRSDNCYLLAPAWQNEISQILTNKNFIYE